MATKKEVHKRRVQAQRRADAQAAAAARKNRRRRVLVGGVAGIVAVAMVASLALVGFLAIGGTSPDVDDFPEVFDDLPQPVEIAAVEPGAVLTGDTPCPATDGTQERTTSFETAPPICIDAEAGYDVSLTTEQGEIVVAIDTTDAEAANLFITNSWYGVYDDVPFILVIEDGLAITGDPGPGDAGFTIPARDAVRPYAPGDVIMWTNEVGGIGTQFAIITSSVMAETFNSIEPDHPIVGTIAAGTATMASILDIAGAPGGPPLADIRISAATVTAPG